MGRSGDGKRKILWGCPNKRYTLVILNDISRKYIKQTLILKKRHKIANFWVIYSDERL